MVVAWILLQVVDVVELALQAGNKAKSFTFQAHPSNLNRSYTEFHQQNSCGFVILLSDSD
jgi:hypothetical protein